MRREEREEAETTEVEEQSHNANSAESSPRRQPSRGGLEWRAVTCQQTTPPPPTPTTPVQQRAEGLIARMLLLCGGIHPNPGPWMADAIQNQHTGQRANTGGSTKDSATQTQRRQQSTETTGVQRKAGSLEAKAERPWNSARDSGECSERPD